MSRQYTFGLNTRNVSTSNRTATAIRIGSLKGGSKGSISRIYKWCNNTCPSDPIACVFKQFDSNVINNNNNDNNENNKSWTFVTNIVDLNLGAITGNIGEDGQIILGGSNGGKLQYSSNFGNTWQSYPNSPDLPTGINVVPWSSVVMSDNTNYVVGTPYVPDTASSDTFNQYNGIWFTANKGSTWTLLQQCPFNGGGTLYFNNSPTGNKLLFIDAGISQDGKYMAAITTPRSGNGELVYLIASNDYGTNWVCTTLNPYTQDIVTTVTSSISICNSSNDYLLITSKLYYNSFLTTYENGTCCVSQIGQSFVVPSGVTGNDFIYSSISDSGQYQVVVTASNVQAPNTGIPSRLYLSTNSGTNFSTIIELPYTNDNDYMYFGGVSMSANGQYITASVLDYNNGFQYITVSSNYGDSWKNIYNDSNGDSFNLLATFDTGFINTNYSGKYQILTGTNQLFLNSNYGN
jgi:hypothetical protein